MNFSRELNKKIICEGKHLENESPEPSVCDSV